MSCAVDVVRWVLVFACLKEFDRVIEGHDLVPAAVDHEDGTVNLRNAIDVRELVERKCPAQIKDYS